MDEYINKAELIEQYPELDGYTFADVTTIDIVTCKECKWWKPYPCKSCEGGHGITDADWFCADGERRTE